MTFEFTDILQKAVIISCNNKILRQGKILLVSQKDFYITLTLEIKGQMKKYEIPYPFKIEKTKDLITFDYTIDTLCRGNAIKSNLMHTIAERYNPIKFFNNNILIELS